MSKNGRAKAVGVGNSLRPVYPFADHLGYAPETHKPLAPNKAKTPANELKEATDEFVERAMKFFERKSTL